MLRYEILQVFIVIQENELQNDHTKNTFTGILIAALEADSHNSEQLYLDLWVLLEWFSCRRLWNNTRLHLFRLRVY